ncbi:hypothetical protein [Flavobacterium degerlachei]|jgi:hypothetical protein|uniref:Uncharacterized protein n=1 Tax=Flavobacterium degerlachei TaxID=229203 RepID=A0A1H2SKV0_9FLAO|nr:hypothetical protein [Flavobacterium degerlachei]SDW32276.1 hypothetical protein SAMN05444338_102106 [Flavobacterium degerlachei]
MKEFKLENKPKIESGFKTPEHYFENFSEKLMQNLPANEPKIISIFQRRKKSLMIAAAILIMALMVPILYNTTANKELDEATLENYLSYQTNMTQFDLINVLESEDIDNINTTIALEDKTIEDMMATNPDLELLLNE